MVLARIQEAEEKPPGVYIAGPFKVPGPFSGQSMRISIPRSGLGWTGLVTKDDVISVMMEISSDKVHWTTWCGFTTQGGEKMTSLGVAAPVSAVTRKIPDALWYRVVTTVAIPLSVAVDVE